MNPSLIEEVRTIAADVFRVPRSQISEASTPNHIESWDSIQHVNLVLTLEHHFDIEFDPEEISHMASVGDIAQILSRKLNNHT